MNSFRQWLLNNNPWDLMFRFVFYGWIWWPIKLYLWVCYHLLYKWPWRFIVWFITFEWVGQIRRLIWKS